MIKVLIPDKHDSYFEDAAGEFSSMWKRITGERPEITTNGSDSCDMVVFGTDAENIFTHQMIMDEVIPGFRLRYGTDDYHLLSALRGTQNLLFIAAGNIRSRFYAVYDFFERRCNCHYFWDGDRIPDTESIDITGLDVLESPRFEYRGLRYFAHRSLKRFQAEHWDFEDWKREFDWVLKKRLNMTMMRIGIEDLFQKAFPDIVPYPEFGTKAPERFQRSHYDRTTFWSLEYRGELRKKVLAYGRSRGLIQPEDCGTMTHWYSRTPQEFLDTVKPDFVPQEVEKYGNDPTGMVWDIRDEANLDNYFKLTEAHILEYGSPDCFHTIGLAERRSYNDRDKNLRFKLYAYWRIITKLREHYPDAPLLIASWDFVSTWTHDEVKEFIAKLNPRNTIILDYTSDIYDEVNNFRNWGLRGKFPWIYGIFHAYEACNEIRGNYGNICNRFPEAIDDPMCKGVVFWPENSHQDILMLDFFPAIAWNPENYRIEDFIDGFCKRRYPSQLVLEMNRLWHAVLPIAKASLWGGHSPNGPMREIYPDMYFQLLSTGSWSLCENNERTLEFYRHTVDELASLLPLCKQTLHCLGSFNFKELDEFTRRDIIDIARTIWSRMMNYAIAKFGLLNAAWCCQISSETSADELSTHLQNMRILGRLFSKLLAASPDFSLNSALEDMQKHHPVNPVFEYTLKGNAESRYCRSFIYELAHECYEKELEHVICLAETRIQGNDHSSWNGLRQEFEKAKKSIADAFYEKPLAEMKPDCDKAFAALPQVLTAIANIEF